jgi:archaellum biogenesis protein FlaJ (TadC family)
MSVDAGIEQTTTGRMMHGFIIVPLLYKGTITRVYFIPFFICFVSKCFVVYYLTVLVPLLGKRGREKSPMYMQAYKAMKLVTDICCRSKSQTYAVL